MEEVLAAVVDVNGVAKENAGRVGELNLVVEALLRLTGDLDGEVNLFNVGDGCLRAAPRPGLSAEPATPTWVLNHAQQTAAEAPG